MKTMQNLIIVTVVALVAGCAAVVPNELVKARSAYKNASEGPAAQFVPAELHKAHGALILAEESFKKDPKSRTTKDLAYVAQRKAELTAALGAMAADKATKERADAEFQQKQSEIVIQGKQDLSAAEKTTAETLAAMAAVTAESAVKEKAAADLQQAQAALVVQGKQDLIESEKRTDDALAELAKLAAVKEEARGLVITLSGSVLFRSTESNLLPSAQDKLDQVANALLATSSRHIVVEGHTDSEGSESYNQGLSQRRADAVRDYLVQKGYPGDRIQSRGKGESSPIADNASPEGRANNRRVEIVIERAQTSNP